MNYIWKWCVKTILGKIHVFYLKYIVEIKSQHRKAITYQCLIHALRLFPDNKLIDNERLAQSVSKNIFEDISVESISGIDADQFERLLNSISFDDWSINIISNYFLLDSFYYSKLGQSESESENAFKKAK